MSKLEDISVFIGSGITPLRSNNLFWNKKEIPWLKTEQLGEFIIYDTNEYITKYALENTSIKLFPKNTISIAMYGEGKTRGNVSIFGKEMCTNQACCNIIVDKKKADYRYVYYWLKNNYYNLRNLAVGVRKNLNSDDIKKFEIDLKTLPMQKQIADLLFCIDSKIQNNNKINSELESMAKTLYDYWFLQFEYPNDEGKPYKTSGGKMVWNEELKREIPEGWDTKELLSFSSWESASQPPKNVFLYTKQDGYVRFIQNRDYESDTKITYIPLKKTTKLCNEYDILIDKYGDKTSGTVRYGLKGAYNVALGKLTPTIKNSQEYIRFFLSTKHMFNHLHNACNASTRSSMNETVFKGIFVPIPNDKLLKEFSDFSKKIIEKKLIIKRENQELSSLRDFLLSLLMNGQVHIE